MPLEYRVKPWKHVLSSNPKQALSIKNLSILKHMKHYIKCHDHDKYMSIWMTTSNPNKSYAYSS